MSGKQRIPTGNKPGQKRRIAPSPIEHSPPEPSQRLRIPAKRPKKNYEDEIEITFADINHYATSPARAPSDDDELPTSVLPSFNARMEGRVGSGRVNPALTSALKANGRVHARSQDVGDESDGDYFIVAPPQSGDGRAPIRCNAHKDASKHISTVPPLTHSPIQDYDECYDEGPQSQRFDRYQRLSHQVGASIGAEGHSHSDHHHSDGSDARDRYGHRADPGSKVSSSDNIGRDRMSYREYESQPAAAMSAKSTAVNRPQKSFAEHSNMPAKVAYPRIPAYGPHHGSPDDINRGRSPAAGVQHDVNPHQHGRERKPMPAVPRSPSWDMDQVDADVFTKEEVKQEQDGAQSIGPHDVVNANDDKLNAVYYLEDYDDKDLPPLSGCELKATWVPPSSGSSEVVFMEMSFFIPDLQENELRMLESGHHFELSIPYANIGVCRPYCFELESASNRLIWSNEFVTRSDRTVKTDKPRNVVGIMLGIVRNPNLKKAVNLSFKSVYVTRRLGIRPMESSLKRMARLMATKLQWPVVKASLDNGSTINFSVKGSSASSSSSPVARRYSRPAKNSSTDASATGEDGIPGGYYPNFLDFGADVKVYDARNTDFRFIKEHLDKLHELPEYNTFTEDRELNRQCVVAVGYTLNAYGVPQEQPSTTAKDCPTISTNIQFAILIAILPYPED